jgi:hypothetical protein
MKGTPIYTVQPRGELGIAPKRVETRIRLDEDLLRQVWSKIAIAGESIAPGDDAGAVTTEQLVEKLTGSVRGRRQTVLGNQGLV